MRPDAFADLSYYGYAAEVDRGEARVAVGDGRLFDARRAPAARQRWSTAATGFTPPLIALPISPQRVRTGEVGAPVLPAKVDKLGKREAQVAGDAAQEVLGEFVTESPRSCILTRRCGVSGSGTPDAASLMKPKVAEIAVDRRRHATIEPRRHRE
jgi:hypothetical protein